MNSNVIGIDSYWPIVVPEAICEAVARPNMNFVPVKTAEQQAVLGLHRGRQSLVKARTAQANQIRGLAAEFGMVIPQGIGHIAKRLAEILEDGENGLPGMMRQLLERLGENLKYLDQQVEELEVQIRLWHGQNEQSRKIEKITERDVKVREDAAWCSAAAAYVVAKSAVDRAGAALEAAKAQLVLLTSHPSEQGNGVTVTRYVKAGSVDYKKVPELKDVDLERYRAAAKQEVRITLCKA